MQFGCKMLKDFMLFDRCTLTRIKWEKVQDFQHLSQKTPAWWRVKSLAKSLKIE